MPKLIVNCCYTVLFKLKYNLCSNNTVVLCYVTWQAHSMFVLKHTSSYQASEILFGVSNSKSGICYIYNIYGTYAH